MSDDTSDDAAEFRCLVPFPDASHSFVHGFEAGMLWQRMIAGEEEIDNEIAYHIANREVFERMAAAMGYDVGIEPCMISTTISCDTWMMAVFKKRRNRFSVIQGGQRDEP